MKKLSAVLFGIILASCAVTEAADNDRSSGTRDENQPYTGSAKPSVQNSDPATSDNSDYLSETDLK